MLGALALAAHVPEASVPVASAAVVGAAVLDLSHLRTGSPRPWSVQQQVPRLWARIFPLPGATILYGLRLGVGPLTHLRSWLWWAGVLVGATVDPWTSAALGATFGGWRIVVQLAAVRGATEAMAERMGRVRGLEQPVTAPLLVAVLVGAGAAALGG